MSNLNKALLGLCFTTLVACSQETSEPDSSTSDATPSPTAAETAVADSRPNFLLIVADDLGYTDLGVYGSEISTPNLDQLASEGLILTDFHNQAVCAPTRAALLSGTDNHNAGGAMHQTANQKSVPGYESYLNDDVVPFSTQLQSSGYNTFMAGKWHLGATPDKTPNARGFDKSFALMQGGASHYSDARGMFEWDRVAFYKENGEDVASADLPDDFYSSNFYTDYIIDAIDSSDLNEPWLAYLAFTAPHWPLQAPDEYIAKYKGAYDDGYEVLRAERIARAKELGVIPSAAATYPKLERIGNWDSLSEEEKAVAAKEMEIYAGMVDSMDENIGRLINHLKEIGEYENTLIVFMADNGAEGADRNPGDNGTDWTFDNSFENMGRVGSHIYYSAKWAQAGVGVMRYYKSYSSEGGTRGPAIIHHPALTKAGTINDEFISVIDIAPTFLDLAGVEPATTNAEGTPLKPMQGESLVPFLLGDADSVRAEDFTFGWEVFGHRALRKGDWKLLWLTSEPAERAQPLAEKADRWGLYNLAEDPGEVNDLSEAHPEIVADLLAEWEIYVAENGVVLPER